MPSFLLLLLLLLYFDCYIGNGLHSLKCVWIREFSLVQCTFTNFNTMSPCINVHRMIYVIRKGSICRFFNFSQIFFLVNEALAFANRMIFSIRMKQRNTSEYEWHRRRHYNTAHSSLNTSENEYTKKERNNDNSNNSSRIKWNRQWAKLAATATAK